MRLSRHPHRHLLLPGLALAGLLALAACDTAEERAESHYQRGMAFVAEGDVERATIEFRNVFRLNGSHTPARVAFARLLREQGDVQGAIAQYLRLVEQDRHNAEGHRDLADLALRIQDFEAAEIHVERAYALAPEDPLVRALKAAVTFHQGDRAGALAMAEDVLAEAPDSVPAHMVLIAGDMAARDFAAALARTEAALAAAPDDEGLHLARLAAFERAGDLDAVGEQLRRMAALFPDNAGVTGALVQWHLHDGDAAAAEALLRAIAGREPEAAEGHLAVVQFLLETEGPEGARAELERLIAAAADARPYRRALAELDFAAGRRAEAIAALGDLLEDQAPSEETRAIQVALARMLVAAGDAPGAAGLLEAALETDRGHVEALKLRARLRIEADEPEQAIQDLRTALSQAPRDPEIMTIMAVAHEREGARELAGERLALAVETSGYGAAESLRYARFLLQEGRTGHAEGVVVDALRRAPDHLELLTALGEIHLARRDWPRVRQVVERLRAVDAPAAADAAADAAAGLELASLRAQDRIEDTIALLEQAAAEGRGDRRAGLGLVRAHVAAGDLDAARARLERILAEDPADPGARMMRAGLHVLDGETAAAEALYREMIAERPGLGEPYRALALLHAGAGRDAAALAVLDDGIAATGARPELRVAKAGLLEARGDFEGAIAIYEELYARDSTNPVIANNLASLISAHRQDAEDLERAFRIARRLRGSDVPQFQDTYGWILVRRGDPEQALAYLEPAAAALAEDPLVQYHLGMAYLALERREDARAALARAVAVAGAASDLPQIEAARARIAEIDARPGAASETASGG